MNYQGLQIVLLSALLLFGQGNSIAHEFGHDLHVEDNVCSDCLTQSVFDDSSASLDQNVALSQASDSATGYSPFDRPKPELLASTARAPPRYS